MTRIHFIVPGAAQPAGSKRAFYKQGMAYARVVEDNHKSGPWKERVALCARAAHAGAPIEGAIELSVVFRRLRPRGHMKPSGGLRKSAPLYPTTRPDATKLLRALEDALKRIAWVDDSQVVLQRAAKEYAEREETEVTITKIDTVNEKGSTGEETRGALTAPVR